VWGVRVRGENEGCMRGGRRGGRVMGEYLVRGVGRGGVDDDLLTPFEYPPISNPFQKVIFLKRSCSYKVISFHSYLLRTVSNSENMGQLLRRPMQRGA
jgi:hypothetical protein